MTELTTRFEEVQLIYRNKTRAKDRVKIKCAAEAYSVLKRHWDQNQIELIEEVKMLLMDRDNSMMSIADISKGGMAGVTVDAKVVFVTALKRRAHSIILAHNHPSGQLKPSRQDIQLTKRLVEAGQTLDLQQKTGHIVKHILND